MITGCVEVCDAVFEVLMRGGLEPPENPNYEEREHEWMIRALNLAHVSFSPAYAEILNRQARQLEEGEGGETE